MNFKKCEIYHFDGNGIRCPKIDGVEMIVARDIVVALGHPRTSIDSMKYKMLKKVDAADRGECIVPTNRGPRAVCIVTPAGARRMIAGSEQPLAPFLRAWLDSEFPSDPAAPLDEVGA